MGALLSSIPSLRNACLSDLPDLLALEAQFPGDRMPRRALRRAILLPSARFRVIERQGALLGDALLLLRRDSSAARLYSLIVSGKARGQGLAAVLLDDAEAQARLAGRSAMRLEVRADNVVAIRLYQRAGFVEFGRRPGYYADGAEAVRMRKQL
ncbi:MAG: GNAT family N-acetyltransferase [Xanthomonadales bacterium]|nr:GNAT family N-acetyltransferase [Xanthomonadales bacterium]